MPNIFFAEPEDYVKATQRIYRARCRDFRRSTRGSGRPPDKSRQPSRIRHQGFRVASFFSQARNQRFKLLSLCFGQILKLNPHAASRLNTLHYAIQFDGLGKREPNRKLCMQPQRLRHVDEHPTQADISRPCLDCLRSPADDHFNWIAIAFAGTKALILSGWTMPMVFIVLSPVIGFGVALFVSIVTTWIVHKRRPWKLDRWFRRLQLVSAAGYSLGHGTNDAQKGMGIITAALVTAGMMKSYRIPYWVIICCHLAMGGGTMAGRWRIIKTMGQRITKLTPFGGFAAETAGALTLLGTAHFGIPVSTTHTITGAIVGVGASHRLTAVRWGVTRQIVWAWVLTIPGAAILGAALFRILAPLLK